MSKTKSLKKIREENLKKAKERFIKNNPNRKGIPTDLSLIIFDIIHEQLEKNNEFNFTSEEIEKHLNKKGFSLEFDFEIPNFLKKI